MRIARPATLALIALILLLTTGILAGCGRHPNYTSPADIAIDGRTVAVSVDSATQLTATFDGQTYIYSRTSGAGINVGLSGPVDAPSSDFELVDRAVEQWLSINRDWEFPRRVNTGAVAIGLLIAGLGVLSLAKPDTVWYITDGWKFRNAEPSDLGLAMTRIGGVVMVIVGLIMVGNAR